MTTRWLIGTGVVVALLLVGMVVGRSQLSLAAEFLDVGVPPQPVDCAMALPGDAERRPFLVAALANIGLAKTLLIPSSEPLPDVMDGLAPSSAETARRVYAARGVSDDRVVVQAGNSTSTADDLELLGQYLAAHPNTTVAVVTSGFHTRRTRWTIDVQLADHASQIIVISAPNPKFHNASWWQSRTGFRYVVLEYLKLGYYWLRYGNGILWTMVFFAASLVWLVRSRRASLAVGQQVP
jgi:uncharacterized SAM-binding protein YcdF (DUF218 family)